MGLTPALFTSAKPDGTDATKLQPSYWNRVTALLNSLLNGGDAHGSVLYRDTSDTTDGASFAPSATGVLACAGSGQAPTFRALATTDLPSTVPLSLFTSTASASNVSTGETNLITYSLPANTLSANGQKVRITAVANFAANANTKIARVYFGSTQVVSYGGTDSGKTFVGVGVVVRTGATSQVGFSQIQVGSLSGLAVSSTPAETLSGAITIKLTGQSGTASGDVTSVAMFVEWIP
jgi:hypothetical protein